jgi:hypothetical protein
MTAAGAAGASVAEHAAWPQRRMVGKMPTERWRLPSW